MSVAQVADHELVQVPDVVDLGELWRPRFPSPELVRTAAALFAGAPAEPRPPRTFGAPNPVRQAEARRHYITIAPGLVGLRSHDPARAERSLERQHQHEVHWRDQLGLAIHEGREELPPRRGKITGWSAGSRSRMTRAMAELDWAPVVNVGRIPAMVTLTEPGDWLAVVPTADAFKAQIRTFLERWKRAWGSRFVGVWKMEFQRRGAPHWHAFTVPPVGQAGAGRRGRPAVGDGLYFHQWLSLVWADVVDHPDPEERRKHERAGTGVDYALGMRSADPRRLAVYFGKHGQFAAKDYQNSPPEEWIEGTGRYWGILGLERATAEVEILARDADLLARTLRRWSRAKGLRRDVRAPRVRGGRILSADLPVIGLAGAEFVSGQRVKRRRVRRRVAYLARGPGGYVCVNDGPAMAAVLARLVE